MKYKHSSGYASAVVSCITCASGGALLDGGTAEVVSGIALIGAGVVMSIGAMIMASVHGPDPLFWQPIARGDVSPETRR